MGNSEHNYHWGKIKYLLPQLGMLPLALRKITEEARFQRDTPCAHGTAELAPCLDPSPEGVPNESSRTGEGTCQTNN